MHTGVEYVNYAPLGPGARRATAITLTLTNLRCSVPPTNVDFQFSQFSVQYIIAEMKREGKSKGKV